jgi:hypothetical protein
LAPGGGSQHPGPVGRGWQRCWRELDRAAALVEGVKLDGGVGGGSRTGWQPAAGGAGVGQARAAVRGRRWHVGQAAKWGPEWMARIAMTADGVRAEALREGIEEEAAVAHVAQGPRAVAASTAAAGCGRSSKPKGSNGGAF